LLAAEAMEHARQVVALSSTAARHPWTLGSSESHLFSGRHGLHERPAGDMNLGLGHQQFPARLEAGVDLAEQSSLIQDFMDHHEGQVEIGLSIDPQAVLLALVGFDAVAHARPLSPPP